MGISLLVLHLTVFLWPIALILRLTVNGLKSDLQKMSITLMGCLAFNLLVLAWLYSVAFDDKDNRKCHHWAQNLLAHLIKYL